MDAIAKNRVIQENALQYEVQVVKQHHEKYNQLTWHQSVIPERVYHASGYINDYNKHRLNRKMNYRKSKECTLLPDYGLDFISYDHLNDTYHGGQAIGWAAAKTIKKKSSKKNLMF